MNGVGAAKVLMPHLSEITDGAYKIATEIAIEIILQDAVYEWEKIYSVHTDLTVLEYLGLTQEEYERWVKHY
jgi:hypothetical protein